MTTPMIPFRLAFSAAARKAADVVKTADGKMAERFEKLARAIYDNAGMVKFV